MVTRKKRIPKNGDRVTALTEDGTFVIYNVDSSIRTVEMKLVGRDFALSSIPWEALTFLDPPHI